MADILKIPTVDFEEKNTALLIIDQTKLPNETVLLSLTKKEEIREAIYMLRVRGAPAIGVAASIGFYVCAERITLTDREEFLKELRDLRDYLSSSRPTAVNLSWALNRVYAKAVETVGSVEDIKRVIREEAIKIKEEDTEICRRIGEYGLTLIKDGYGILTHCNAGQLATSKYGTALAPIHIGREKGLNFKVFCDETRPLLQGARLSAYEMVEAGADTTLICDNMASQVMKNGWIDAVFVGADRIAANGDCCNKIGTSGVAILAKYYDIPFYVCAPISTIDMTMESGDSIIIEQRPGNEITDLWYEKPMAPKGVKTFNPAFDVTPAELVTAIITEKGICMPSYKQSFKSLFSSLK